MGDAYTPGLTVTNSAVVRKTRRLPLTGTVSAEVGQDVTARDVVARTELPGKVHLINFANALGIIPDEVEASLRAKPGQPIREGQILAESKGFFGLSSSYVKSPTAGVFESVSSITGQAMLREPPTPVEVTAYLDGRVVEVIENEGVVIETKAAMVQGIFGLAGEVYAPLRVVADSPDQPLLPTMIASEHKGQVIVGGGHASLVALQRAVEVGVAAVVVGGFAYHDIKELLGYDIGVAVTGTEPLATTLVVTEGFGDIAMARATFELLQSHDGDYAAVNGATQIRAGVIRPEVVIPLKRDRQEADVSKARGLDVGVSVRCIRAPYFGRIGEVASLPVALHTMPSETKVRVLEVRFTDGETIVIPRANVEVIEH